jgi:hypothetical protein
MLLTSRQTYHEVRGINYSLTVFDITGVSHFEHTGPSLNTACRSKLINIVVSEWQVEKLILLQWVLLSSVTAWDESCRLVYLSRTAAYMRLAG